CLAPHSHLRGAIIPTPCQQGVDEEETDTGSPLWSWARLLKRVFALDMVRCPWCQRGALRLIAAITSRTVRSSGRSSSICNFLHTHLPLHQPVSARKPSPGPLPDHASCVTDPPPTAVMGRDHAVAVST